MVVANIYLMDMHKKKCSEFCDADQISSVLSETQPCSKSSDVSLFSQEECIPSQNDIRKNEMSTLKNFIIFSSFALNILISNIISIYALHIFHIVLIIYV